MALGFLDDIDLGKFVTRILSPSERQIDALERLTPVAVDAYTRITGMDLLRQQIGQQGPGFIPGVGAGQQQGSYQSSQQSGGLNIKTEHALIGAVAVATVLFLVVHKT